MATNRDGLNGLLSFCDACRCPPHWVHPVISAAGHLLDLAGSARAVVHQDGFPGGDRSRWRLLLQGLHIADIACDKKCSQAADAIADILTCSRQSPFGAIAKRV